MRVVTAKQMKEIEARAADFDMTAQRLMENAGSAAAAFIRRTLQPAGRNCMVFCGSGNNGGDGFVVARKLYENDVNVLLIRVGEAPRSEEALAMYTTAELMEIPVADFGVSQDKVLDLLGQADIIVDALYGAGFHGALTGDARTVCAAINSSIAAVVSLDMPSGVECDTAIADPDAVRADFTVAFDSRKPVHALPAGAEYCGQVEVVDIGIPQEAKEGLASRAEPLTTELAFAHLHPRDLDSHKGTYGRVLLICGSAQYRGAAALAVKGALRCGAGIVTLASTERVCAAVAAQVSEATFLPLPEDTATGGIDSEGARLLLLEAAAEASAILFGCGLGNDPRTLELLRHLLYCAVCPVVIDADGINALATNINVLQEAKATVILTPHPGEMARLCSTSVAQIQEDRGAAAMELAESQGAVVVLKGRETLIANPVGGLMRNSTGNPGLAKGGSGDVLAGMIVALAGQGIDPVHAAASGVHLHGLAADRCADRLSQYAMLPSELLDDLAQILRENGR